MKFDKSYLSNGGRKPPTTLPKTNIAPENRWLEDQFPFGMTYFHGRAVSFREGSQTNHLVQLGEAGLLSTCLGFSQFFEPIGGQLPLLEGTFRSRSVAFVWWQKFLDVEAI